MTESAVEKLGRSWKCSDGVRKVCAKHDVVDRELLVKLDCEGIPDDSEMTVLSNIFAGFLVERNAEAVAVDLIVVIENKQRERKPARIRLSEVEPKIGKAIEDTADDQLSDAEDGNETLGAKAQDTRELKTEAVPSSEPFELRVSLAESEMRTQTHIQLQASRPEPIVLVGRETAPIGELVEADRRKPTLRRELQFIDRVVNARDR